MAKNYPKLKFLWRFQNLLRNLIGCNDYAVKVEMFLHLLNILFGRNNHNKTVFEMKTQPNSNLKQFFSNLKMTFSFVGEIQIYKIITIITIWWNYLSLQCFQNKQIFLKEVNFFKLDNDNTESKFIQQLNSPNFL